MDIVIVCQYLSDIEDFSSNNNRFVYLAKLLSTTNRIEIVTSDFNHAKKTWFGPVDLLHGVSITTLHEPGYPKNISLKRLYSHNILAKNIIQNPNPKKAVHTNFDGLMNGHNAQRNEKKRAANPHTPIIDFHKP